jgi:hypothetical protein
MAASGNVHAFAKSFWPQYRYQFPNIQLSLLGGADLKQLCLFVILGPTPFETTQHESKYDIKEVSNRNQRHELIHESWPEGA